MFPDSSLVFVPDSQAKYVPARVLGAIHPGQNGMVALLDDSGRPKFQLELPGSITATLIPMDEESLRSIPDMVDLKVLTEAALLHNLRLRFRTDDIYTAIGDILIALNPFKLLPLYTPLVVDSYVASNSPSTGSPHVYKLADLAFRRLVEVKKNQACMVTGESGSGKTETTKIFLQYLAEVSSAWSNSRRDGVTVDEHSPSANISNAALSDKILKSNPLLESFGNASTRKNTNSSRFGKLIEVSIDTKTTEIVGARTTIFLLEKSRLPSPAHGERNFHVFYQLCAGARVHPEIKDQYEVLDPDEYRYLSTDGVPHATKVGDIMGWEELMKAMKVLKIPLEMRDETLRIVSGILHLGNLEFEMNQALHHAQATRVTNVATLHTVERLLGMTDLEKALTVKSVSAATEVVSHYHSVEKVRKLRDALAISIYSTLFNFLASRINDTMMQQLDERQPTAASLNQQLRRTMGVLDIFGFESFPGPNNSFEQLCINYCNEKLQHQFNEFVFFRERAEYEREGVSISSNPSALLERSQKSTQLVLELFERPKHGLFHLMDEESAVPGGSDQGLLKRIVNEFSGKNPSFQTGKKDLLDSAFVVRHYVGPVIYKIAGLLEKNDEGSLSKDLQQICSRSTLEIIRTTPAVPKSHLGTQFASQLDSLVKSLAEMEPHFIRCIKPNVERKGGQFNAQMVLDQLRCAGILEVCKIRQLGYPIRRDFIEFKNRYAALAKRSTTKRFLTETDAKRAVEALCLEFTDTKLLGDTFACGKTKIFLKSNALVALEETLEKLKVAQSTKIQSRARGYLVRQRMALARLALAKVVQATADSNLAELRGALTDDSIRRLLGGGKHLPQIQSGWKKAAMLQEEMFGRNLIQRAINSKNAHAVRSALACTVKIVPRTDSIVLQAESMLKSLDMDELVFTELEEKTSAKVVDDYTELGNLVDKAMEIMKRRGNEPVLKKRLDLILEKSKTKLARVRVESETRRQLEEGLDEKSSDQVVQAKSKLKAIGVSNEDSLIRRASMFLKEDLTTQSLMDDEEALPEAIQVLQESMNAKDADGIAKAMVRVIAEGLESHSVAEEAIKLEKSLRKTEQDEKILNDVSSVIEMKTNNKEGTGLEAEDLVLVEQVKEQVEDEALKAKAEQIIDAAQEIIDAQNGLYAALAIGPSIEFSKLRQTLERAYAAGLTGGELVYRVQKMMRAKNRERRLAKKKVVFDLDGNAPEKRKKKPTMDMKAFQLEKMERSQSNALVAMSRSEGDRYVISNYYQIRPRLEGDPPRIQHKNGQVLETSILETTPTEKAETISKLILGYTGERSVSFPPTCAQTLLETGLEGAEIADEIYVQLVAHLTQNMNAESATRTWQLLCLTVATFFPSQDLLLFVVRFLVDRAEGRTDAALGAERPSRGPLATTMDNYTLEQRYALYCLKKLQKELASSDTIQIPVPSLEEIQAFGERVPVVTDITLPDGTVLIEDALITPMMTVKDVTGMCLSAMRINQPEIVHTYGLFVRPVDKTAIAAALNSLADQHSFRESSKELLKENSFSERSKEDEDSKRSALRNSLRLQKASSRTRFRLSITAVFGFGRSTGGGSKTNEPASPVLPPSTVIEDQEDTNNNNNNAGNGGDGGGPALFSSPQRAKATVRGHHQSSPAKKTTQIGLRRMEEDVDWDVPLIPQEHVGDVLLRYLRAGRGAPRLVFKKRIFLPAFEAKAEETRKASKTTEMGETQLAVMKIESLQAIDDFATGALPFDKEDEVAEVVAARVALKFDNKLPASDPERLMAIGQIESLIPAPWRNRRSELNWARTVLEKKGKIVGKDADGLRMKIVERCRQRPLYGSQIFRVTRKGDPFESLLAVSERGFGCYSIKDHRTIIEYGFDSLEDFKVGRGGTFVLQPRKPSSGEGTVPKPVTFITPNGREIVELAKEYQLVSAPPAKDQNEDASKATLSATERRTTPPNGGHVRQSSHASSVGGDESEASTHVVESLRERMVKLGATQGDIADVLRV